MMVMTGIKVFTMMMIVMIIKFIRVYILMILFILLILFYFQRQPGTVQMVGWTAPTLEWVVKRFFPDKIIIQHSFSGCFLFNASQKYILDDAQSYCQGVENATLIEIHTEEQLDFFKMARFAIEGQDRRKGWWLGGTDRGRNGDFCIILFGHHFLFLYLQGRRLVLDELSSSCRRLCVVANPTKWGSGRELHVLHG